MKKLKEIFNQVSKVVDNTNSNDITELLLQLICYSPKTPVRLQYQQLMSDARCFTLEANDPHFSGTMLKFNGFIWGNGKYKVLITHGWGSKAADFGDLITGLQTLDDLQIIAFDAPGNGSSEAELSNVLLFVRAIEAIINVYGKPDVMIGHSVGAMANAIAINATMIKPSLLISIAPLIMLKENFIATMRLAKVPKKAQDRFFESFQSLFETEASDFNLNKLYKDGAAVKHWLAYDPEDIIAPYNYLEGFLTAHPDILTQEYQDVGHERIIKNPELIAAILELVKLIGYY
ncbi:MAG: alpha/beta hydrolase [Mucilaginibacter sp.]|uniref:alpha/beta fold hydrolase n=1 Tax=Mucilaginibacter sp. TaxID=1882438 RepID=UPI0031A21463